MIIFLGESASITSKKPESELLRGTLGEVGQLELIFRSMLGAGKPREWKNRHALVSFFVFWVI